MKNTQFVLINFYLYTILLIITPFLMLQNYLQNAIGMASRAMIDLDFIKIPYTVLIAILILSLFFYLSRKIITKKRILYLGLILLFIYIGQKTSDYYFGHHFYDLQFNWHYFAYGIFSFVAFRRFSIKPKPLYRILLSIFFMALLISTFDEFIQIYISGRVFDLSDVGKDLWGNMAGSIFVFFYLEDSKGFPNFKLRQKKLKDYIKNPFSLFCLETIFAFIFLFVASQLTEKQYSLPAMLILLTFIASCLLIPDRKNQAGLWILWIGRTVLLLPIIIIFPLIFITLLFFIITFLLIHAGRNKIARWIIRSGLLLIIIFVFCTSHFGTPSTKFVMPGYIKYNGIPLLYFDYMIFPNGSFRTVDKKEDFNVRDRQTIAQLDPDILLIGKGSKGQGGRGWTDIETTEMVYNTFEHKIYQIIKLPNRQACETFNRLKKQNKKVLFIIYNE